ncbi:MAG: hypothetical protein ACJ795_12860 [Ktedonobacteraceae bacterium]
MAERWQASQLAMVAFQKQKSLVALVRVLPGRSVELLSTENADETTLKLFYEPTIGMVSGT